MEKKFEGFEMNKKGQMGSDKLLDKMIDIIVFATVGAVGTPLVLEAFLNLSTSGIALSALFGTVLGIVFAVFIFRGIFKSLKN